MMRALKLSFAESHIHLIFSSMTRTSLFKPMTEGVIDFDAEDIDTIARIIREKPVVKINEKGDLKADKILTELNQNLKNEKERREKEEQERQNQEEDKQEIYL